MVRRFSIPIIEATPSGEKSSNHSPLQSSTTVCSGDTAARGARAVGGSSGTGDRTLERGTSVAMIESHYGRYLERDGERELQLLMGSDAVPIQERKVARRHAKMVTLEVGSPFLAEKPLWSKASPTGFEPLPAGTTLRGLTHRKPRRILDVHCLRHLDDPSRNVPKRPETARVDPRKPRPSRVGGACNCDIGWYRLGRWAPYVSRVNVAPATCGGVRRGIAGKAEDEGRPRSVSDRGLPSVTDERTAASDHYWQAHCGPPATALQVCPAGQAVPQLVASQMQRQTLVPGTMSQCCVAGQGT
jgi:hypothetical protein